MEKNCVFLHQNAWNKVSKDTISIWFLDKSVMYRHNKPFEIGAFFRSVLGASTHKNLNMTRCKHKLSTIFRKPEELLVKTTFKNDLILL